MKFPVTFLTAIVLFSCDRTECVNRNPVLAKYSPESNEYKAELVRQLRTHKDAKFYIDSYTTRNGRKYMIVYVQDKSLCAKAALDITNTNELEQFKAVAGRAYSGAGLRGLQYRIDSTDGHYTFIFEHVSWIVD